ncbi:MAG: DUF7847 domain-containing protein [Candidatus Syntropharchaeia archaeon]
MTENLSTVFGEGFDTWKKNLNICLPFVFDLIIGNLILIVIVGCGILLSTPWIMEYLMNPPKIQPEVVPELISRILPSIGTIIAAFIIAFIIRSLIGAFFIAGAIGMAKEAIETGTANLSHMMEYGKRKFISLFLADAILGVIAVVGIVFLIPGAYYVFSNLSEFLQSPPPEMILSALILLGTGFLLMFVYVLIVQIIFAPVRYAVVIDDLGSIDGIKRGFRFFMERKLDVFLLWLIIAVINILAGFIGNIPYVGWLIGVIISAFVIQPLGVTWWSRLYLA